MKCLEQLVADLGSSLAPIAQRLSEAPNGRDALVAIAARVSLQLVPQVYPAPERDSAAAICDAFTRFTDEQVAARCIVLLQWLVATSALEVSTSIADADQVTLADRLPLVADLTGADVVLLRKLRDDGWRQQHVADLASTEAVACLNRLHACGFVDDARATAIGEAIDDALQLVMRAANDGREAP